MFVSLAFGNDNHAGTPDQPVRTLKQAIALAQGKTGRVYACVGSPGFSEAVEVPAGISLYGGLDCAIATPKERWKYIGNKARTALTVIAEQIPLVLSGTGTIRIEDFEVSAQPAGKPGGSSIAVVVDGATAALVRCTLLASNGMPGATGEPFPTTAQGGLPGKDGAEACSTETVGAPPVTSMCGNPDSSSGRGGNGLVTSGEAGEAGLPGPTNGGTGEGNNPCTTGDPGDPGVAGTPGAGATGMGKLSGGGYIGIAGTAGTRGGPGQGGGGGGGAKGGKCPIGAASNSGASGGSGGSGGCGGAGGNGGGAGGSSIALISLNASLTLTKVKLLVGNGGKGGDGGQGQNGGKGAMMVGKGGGKGSAVGLNSACAGGAGGNGGKGGQGGGGLGGHSIGLAYVGQNAPAMADVSFEDGLAGSGGKGADSAPDGAAGVQANVQAFP